MVSTCHDADIQNAAKFLSRERKERLECYCKSGTDLKGYIQYGCSPVHIGLCHLPRLGISEIFITETGNIHCFLEGLTELVGVEITLHLRLERLDLSKSLGVDCLRLEVRRNAAFEIFMGQHHRTIHEVAEDGNKLAIVTCLEILP